MQINDETFIAQKTFRALLQAMSHPGRVYSLSQESELNGLILVLQTLLDHEVTFNVFGHQKDELEYKAIRATGSKTANIEDADFIIIPSGNSEGVIINAKRGTLEYPDTGATVIYSIRSLSARDNGGLKITLKGPGINGEISSFLSGVSKSEFIYLKEINSEYPLGIDSVFIDSENNIMCIPRSTKIEVK